MTDAKNLADYAVDSDYLAFAAQFKDRMNLLVENRLSEIMPLILNEDSGDSIVTGNEAEKDALINIKQTAKTLGSDDGCYEEGCFEVELTSKKAAEDFCAYLENYGPVDEYDCEIYSDTESEEVDWDDIKEGDNVTFTFYVYLDPDIVSYEPGVIEDAEGDEYIDTENGRLEEVKRVIKVNFRGKRRVKMQCNPGFRWDAGSRSCKKISGAALATKRKALRKAVRTKKAQGSGFKVRVKRKTMKALRYRKSMGLG